MLALLHSYRLMALITETTPAKIVLLVFLALLLIYLVAVFFVLDKHLVIPVIPT